MDASALVHETQVDRPWHFRSRKYFVLDLLLILLRFYRVHGCKCFISLTNNFSVENKTFSNKLFVGYFFMYQLNLRFMGDDGPWHLGSKKSFRFDLSCS